MRYTPEMIDELGSGAYLRGGAKGPSQRTRKTEEGGKEKENPGGKERRNLL